MFAVVRTGGKQYRVAPGDKIVVEKLDGNAGDRIELGEVLLAGDGSDLKSTDGLKVAAEIIAQAKGDKVTVFKKRRRHNYRRKKGHRQQHTILRIVSIGDHKAEKKAAPAKAEAPVPAAAAPAAEPTAKPAKAAKPAAADKASAEVNQTATENPAPDNAAAANPPTSEPADGGAKTAKPAKAPSTKSDSSATADAKKSPKAK